MIVTGLFILAFSGFDAAADTILYGGGQKIQISAKNQYLFGLTKWGQVIQWNTTASQWQSLALNTPSSSAAYRAAYIGAWFDPATNNYGVNAVAADYGAGGGTGATNYITYKNFNKAWGTYTPYVYTVSGVEGLAVTRGNCILESWIPTSGVSGNVGAAGCNSLQVASGAVGVWWKLDFDNKLYNYSGVNGQPWTPQISPEYAVNSSLTNVDVSAAGKVVVGDTKGQVHYWDGNGWFLVTGTDPAHQGPNAYNCYWPTINDVAIYCIDQQGEVHQINGFF